MGVPYGRLVPGGARQRIPRHATVPRVVSPPRCPGSNLGDPTKNAGGTGHRTLNTRCGKAFAYEVVVVLVNNILFPCFKMTWLTVPSGTVKYGLPKMDASPSPSYHLITLRVNPLALGQQRLRLLPAESGDCAVGSGLG